MRNPDRSRRVLGEFAELHLGHRSVNLRQLFEYTTKSMVGLGRVELPTNGLGNRCSIHLSYRPRIIPWAGIPALNAMNIRLT